MALSVLFPKPTVSATGMDSADTVPLASSAAASMSSDWQL
jgi:hypothetical protein